MKYETYEVKSSQQTKQLIDQINFLLVNHLCNLSNKTHLRTV